MNRRTLLILGAALSLVSVRAEAQPDTPPPPVEGSSDGSGEAQGGGQMRDTVLGDDAARSHFRVGQLLYSEGRFGDAAREFEQAYFLSNRAPLLYNAFVAYRDANDLEHAIITLDAYLRQVPNIDDATALRRRLDAMRATLESRMDERTNVQEERARLEAERQEFEQQATAARARAAAAEREIARQRSPVPWVVGGAGLALLAGSGVAALIANNHISSAEDACPNHVCPRDANIDLEAQQRSLRRPAITTDVLLGVGGATLVTGVVMLIVRRSGGHSDAADATTPTANVACDRYGCSTSLSRRF